MRGTAVLTLAAALLIVSTQAVAGGGHGRGGYGHRSHGHGHARIGVFIGAPLLLSPWWASSYHYPPAPVVVRERVIVREPLVYYDEQGNPVPPGQTQPQTQAQAQPAQVESPTWFYCADSQSYYPYVKNCASPWQRVAPQPPPPPR